MNDRFSISVTIPLVNRILRRIQQLPLVMLSLTSRCNSRCIMCHYWQGEGIDFPTEFAGPLSRDLASLGCRSIGITGGEPFLHPEHAAIIEKMTQAGMAVFVMTNGILLNRVAESGILESVNSLYVSLDGDSAETHERIRGKGTFFAMAAGLAAVKQRCPKLPLVARCTVQQENWQILPGVVRLAASLGFKRISFVAVDVDSTAYGRVEQAEQAEFQARLDLLPAAESMGISEVDRVFGDSAGELAPFFARGFIEESPTKLSAIIKRIGRSAPGESRREPRCNAPYFSLFIDERAAVHPCFFRPPLGELEGGRIIPLLRSPGLFGRLAIDRDVRKVFCDTCTCPLWRGLF
jgi:Fe-coproporphyrin III synthase